MHKEILALEEKHPWDYVVLSASKRALGCKCVYKVKYNVDGLFEQFKACLVILGSTKVEG